MPALPSAGAGTPPSCASVPAAISERLLFLGFVVGSSIAATVGCGGRSQTVRREWRIEILVAGDRERDDNEACQLESQEEQVEQESGGGRREGAQSVETLAACSSSSLSRSDPSATSASESYVGSSIVLWTLSQATEREGVSRRASRSDRGLLLWL
jgi:hypothetical protein